MALPALGRAGFGFVEVGAATPRPQPGNPRPRLFRLSEDQAVINRFGFNNDGAVVIATRLARRPHGPIVGLNLGANKDSADRADDFAQVLRLCGRTIDFATVNVSSPNTERLRDLQGPDALRALLDGVMAVRAGLDRPIPIFLKIAPDLDDEDLDGIARVARQTAVDAIIATNTTVSREGLKSRRVAERAIGLKMKVAAYDPFLSEEKAKKMGVEKVELDDLLARDGFDTVAQAVGTGRDAWL